MFATTLNREYELAALLLRPDESGVAELARAASARVVLDAAGQDALLGEIGRYAASNGVAWIRLDLCLIRPRTARHQAPFQSMPGCTASGTPADGSSTWEGEEPSAAAEFLLRGRNRTTSAYPADGDDGGQRRVDGGTDRGRGTPARVHLDQGVRTALQRAVPGRQVLSLAGWSPSTRSSRGFRS